MPGVFLTASMPNQIDGVDAIIVLTVAALAVVVLQFFCCWKWRNIFFRLIPGLIDVGFLATFFVLWSRAATTDIRDGYAIYLVIFGIMLAAIVLGWLCWLIYCIAHRRITGNPAGY